MPVEEHVRPSFKIRQFEGPMDLLLQLISKKQVSINDVPILELIEQYLDYMGDRYAHEGYGTCKGRYGARKKT